MLAEVLNSQWRQFEKSNRKRQILSCIASPFSWSNTKTEKTSCKVRKTKYKAWDAKFDVFHPPSSKEYDPNLSGCIKKVVHLKQLTIVSPQETKGSNEIFAHSRHIQGRAHPDRLS